MAPDPHTATAETTAQSGNATPQRTLLRALGLGAATAVVVGGVIGSGIFVKPGTIARDGGEFGLIIAAWVFGGLLCLTGALSYAELAAMLPRAGGEYVYLRETYGRLVAFLYGWNDFLFGKPASYGALSMIFAGALLAQLQQLPWLAWCKGTTTQMLLAIAVIVALGTVNFVGVIWGGWVQLITTIIKASGVALVAITPWIVYATTGDGIEWKNYATTYTRPVTTATPSAADPKPNDGRNDGRSAHVNSNSHALRSHPTNSERATQPRENSMGFFARFGLVLLAVMWAYNGWNGIGPVAEEIREPERNIPRALMIGAAILIVLYVSANVAYYGVLPMDKMAAAGETAYKDVAAKLAGTQGVLLISAVIMCSTFGAINSNLLYGPRVAFAMGRDGVFFRSLGHVHANFRTPSVAIAVQVVMAAGMVLAAALLKVVLAGVNAKSLPWERLQKIVETVQTDSLFTIFTNFAIFSASIFYLLGVAAVLILRWKRPDLPRPYRTFGYPFVPIGFVLVYLWFLWQVFSERPFEALMGLALISLGVPVFFLWQSLQRGTANEDQQQDDPAQ